MPKLPRTTGPRVAAALRRMGFVDMRQKGSHLTMWRSTTNAICTVPMHTRETLPPKTLQSILKQSGISVEELIEEL